MQKISLLVADDEDVFRKGIVRYIELHSDRFDPVFSAVDGEEAEEILFRNKPDIVLLDIRMPKKTGLEVMQSAQQAGILPVTIILSGYDEFKYAQQALRLGAKDYILKPILASKILEKLNEASDLYIEQGPEAESVQNIGDANHFVGAAKAYMEEHFDENLTLERVAEQTGISPGYLSTLFAREVGIGFVEYLNKIRVEHACPYLMQNHLKTYEIAYKVGYRDEKYFSKMFHKIMGVTPSEYRRQKNG